jgi:PAS domain S-box-containing protein
MDEKTGEGMNEGAAKELEAVAAIVNDMLRGEIDDEETEARVLDACIAATGSGYGMIGKIDEHGRWHTTTYSAKALKDCAFPRALAQGPTAGREIRGMLSQPLLEGKPLLCNDPPAYPSRVGLPQGHVPIESFLGAPLKRDSKAVGMVAVANKPGGYTPRDQDTLVRLASVIAVSRQHRIALRQAKTTSAELEQLVDERTQQLRFEAEVTSMMPEGVHLVRMSDGVIVYANPTFEEMLGYGPGKLVGEHISVVNARSKKRSPEETAEGIIRFIEEQGYWKGEIKNVRKDGTRFWCYASVTAFDHPDHGRVALTVQTDINAYKATQHARNRLMAAIEASPDSILITNPEGAVVAANQSALAMWGTKGDLTGKNILDILPGQEERTKAGIEEARVAGSATIEYEVPTGQGGVTPVETLVSLFTNAQGSTMGFITIGRDITERRAADLALRKSEEKYRILFENMAQGAFYQRADGKLIDCNPAALEMFGLTRDQFLGRTSRDPRWNVVHEDGSDLPGEQHPSMVALRTGEAVRGVVAGVFNPSREDYVWLSINAIPQFRPGEDKPYEVFVTLHDISELKKAEEEFEDIFNLSPNMVAVCTTDGSFIRVNPAWEKVLGYTPEELLDIGWAELVHPDDAEETDSEIDRQLEMGTLVSLVNRYRCKDGSYRTFEWQGTFAREGIVHATARDITERKQAEEVLRDNEEKLRIAIVGMDSHVFTQDKDLRFTWAFNPTSGFDDDAIMGRTDADFLPPPEAAQIIEAKERVLETGVSEKSEFQLTVEGKESFYEVTVEPLRDASGDTVGIIGVSRDITERKQAEKQLQEYSDNLEELVEERTSQLRDAQRMAGIGETTTMVGHDLRNPLQAIVNNLYLAKRRLESSEFDGKDDIAKKLETIHEEIGYMNKIVSDLQDFARPVVPRLYKTDIEALARDVLSTSVTDQSTPVSVDVVASEDLPKLTVDADLMKRVLANLVINAIQAMPDGGELTVDLRTQGRDALISVKDTGVGIPEENMGKLFDPLFTTKSMGQGFGLPVCRRLVEAHGGTITAESTAGKGSRFTIRLPLGAS